MFQDYYDLDHHRLGQGAFAYVVKATAKRSGSCADQSVHSKSQQRRARETKTSSPSYSLKQGLLTMCMKRQSTCCKGVEQCGLLKC
eukprot:2815455-Amphidinium_carterae.1